MDGQPVGQAGVGGAGEQGLPEDVHDQECIAEGRRASKSPRHRPGGLLPGAPRPAQQGMSSRSRRTRGSRSSSSCRAK
jgi:hypothetical protein